MLTTRDDVKTALERDEFRLVYQPIVSLDTLRPVGLEALVRWLHPTHGELGPVKFIEQFERNGAIADLGVWVTRRAMSEAAVWHKAAREKGTDLYLSVNASGYELQQIAYSASLVSMCDDFQHRCQDLRVEIIESEFDLGGDGVSANLTTLRSEEIKVMIDDFGIGASTVERIVEVNADAVKLDASLIRDLENNSSVLELISSVVSAAQLAGIEVVAEGIERQSQLDLLREAGCMFGQGYLFARPVSAAEVPALLEA
ncbi:MAG: EAL domain-containing protein [Microbacteriaceae bacterium]